MVLIVNMINEIYINDELIVDENRIKQYILFKIRCIKCNKLYERRVFQKRFYDIPYICMSCKYVGENNPFYGKHHDEESKKLMGGAVVDYKGKNNPFYGKTHTPEVIEKLKKYSVRFGEKNPFYGKHHTPESISKQKESQKQYYIDNKELILDRKLKKRGYTKNILLDMLNDYILNHNRGTFSMKYDIDYRTAESYWYQSGAINKKEFEIIKHLKRVSQNPSIPEKNLHKLLQDKYGSNNVKLAFPVDRYYFDMCIFNKFLIEYDGYY